MWRWKFILSTVAPLPGDLIFIRGNEGIAAPIRKITKSPYTHIAGMVLDDQLIESQGLRKTGYQALSTYKGVSDIFTCQTLSSNQRDHIVDFVTEEIGTRYDYLLIGWMACHHLTRKKAPILRNKRRRICTTLWADAYKAAGIELCPGIVCPTPGELSESTLLEHVGAY